jgi:hypothetical protein
MEGALPISEPGQWWWRKAGRRDNKGRTRERSDSRRSRGSQSENGNHYFEKQGT